MDTDFYGYRYIETHGILLETHAKEGFKYSAKIFYLENENILVRLSTYSDRTVHSSVEFLGNEYSKSLREKYNLPRISDFVPHEKESVFESVN